MANSPHFILARVFLVLVLLGELFLQKGFASPAPAATKYNNQQAPLQDKSNASLLYDDDGYPSWFTSTRLARRLLALSTSGVVSTMFPNPLPSTFPYTHTPPELAGKPVSLKEYIADCDEQLFPSFSSSSSEEEEKGNPIFLALHVATTFQNIKTGSNNISLSIDWWDHLKDAEPVYPGLPDSPAGLPRVTLFGYVEPIVNDESEKLLKECYLRAHPDSEAWFPGRDDSPHSSFWARLVVRQAYWIGGFGDVARIGWLDMSAWKNMSKEATGWGHVRLPGEE